ncbi:hypothetical protein ADUPG1_012344 [Aduncisulcus paluster]|uniref:Uncharacterized protein n=1 Tax=Aduncisulcus paluster TaxID=2918883 RepID=A0ABQ5JZ45_9EUKA|nr:hypothetical protein ADUPG1_012344 [Aduncisulcus paluster]
MKEGNEIRLPTKAQFYAAKNGTRETEYRVVKSTSPSPDFTDLEKFYPRPELIRPSIGGLNGDITAIEDFIERVEEYTEESRTIQHPMPKSSQYDPHGWNHSVLYGGHQICSGWAAISLLRRVQPDSSLITHLGGKLLEGETLDPTELLEVRKIWEEKDGRNVYFVAIQAFIDGIALTGNTKAISLQCCVGNIPRELRTKLENIHHLQLVNEGSSLASLATLTKDIVEPFLLTCQLAIFASIRELETLLEERWRGLALTSCLQSLDFSFIDKVVVKVITDDQPSDSDQKEEEEGGDAYVFDDNDASLIQEEGPRFYGVGASIESLPSSYQIRKEMADLEKFGKAIHKGEEIYYIFPLVLTSHLSPYIPIVPIPSSEPTTYPSYCSSLDTFRRDIGLQEFHPRLLKNMATLAQYVKACRIAWKLYDLAGISRPWLLLKKPDVPLTSVTTLSLPPPLSTPSSSSMSSVPIPDPPVSMLSPRHIPDEFILKALFSLCQNIVPSPPPQPSFFRRAANLSPVGQFMAKSCRKGVVTVSFLAEAARLASQHNVNTPHLHHIPTRADLTAWENGKTQPRETSLSIRDDEKSYDISVMPITKNISFEFLKELPLGEDKHHLRIIRLGLCAYGIGLCKKIREKRKRKELRRYFLRVAGSNVPLEEIRGKIVVLGGKEIKFLGVQAFIDGVSNHKKVHHLTRSHLAEEEESEKSISDDPSEEELSSKEIEERRRERERTRSHLAEEEESEKSISDDPSEEELSSKEIEERRRERERVRMEEERHRMEREIDRRMINLSARADVSSPMIPHDVRSVTLMSMKYMFSNSALHDILDTFSSPISVADVRKAERDMLPVLPVIFEKFVYFPIAGYLKTLSYMSYPFVDLRHSFRSKRQKDIISTLKEAISPFQSHFPSIFTSVLVGMDGFQVTSMSGRSLTAMYGYLFPYSQCHPFLISIYPVELEGSVFRCLQCDIKECTRGVRCDNRIIFCDLYAILADSKQHNLNCGLGGCNGHYPCHLCPLLRFPQRVSLFDIFTDQPKIFFTWPRSGKERERL